MRAAFALAVGFFAAAACAAGTSPLADSGVRAAGGESGRAGSAGTAGLAGKAGVSGAAVAGAAGSGAMMVHDASVDAPQEPGGPFAWTWLNGVADAKTLRLCVVAWDGAPKPSPVFDVSLELSLGGQYVPKLPDEPVAVRPYVLTGAVAGLSGECPTLVVSPPSGVNATGLPVLPASLFSANRSVLFVVAGCVGGVMLNNPEPACGASTKPTPSTLSLVFAELSRLKPDAGKFGLQVVHASTSFGAVQVRVQQDEAEQPAVLLSQLQPGDIEPLPPLSVDPGVFGFVASKANVYIGNAQGGDLVKFGVGQLLDEHGLSESDLGPGGRLVWVLVGAKPTPALGAGNPLRMVWLRAPD